MRWAPFAVLGLVFAQAAFAQDGLPQPAESPPAGFAEDSYVDSTGCGFLRVLVGNEPVWAPRYRIDGTQLCGLQPSYSTQAGTGEGSPLGAQDTQGPADGQAQAAPDADDVSDPAEARSRAPGYYVQAGAFGLRENAFEVRDRFLAQGWGAETQPAGRLTAVFAGPFVQQDEAQAALALIRRQGMPDAFVFRQD